MSIGSVVGGLMMGAIQGARAYAAGLSVREIVHEAALGYLIGAAGGAVGAGILYVLAWGLASAIVAAVGYQMATAQMLAECIVGMRASVAGLGLSWSDYNDAVKKGNVLEQRIAIFGIVTSSLGFLGSSGGFLRLQMPRTTVLGNGTKWVELARSISGNWVSVPDPVWEKMSDVMRWFTLKALLDGAIDRGDTVLLSDKLSNMKENSWVWTEVEYLQKKGGFVLSSDERTLTPPARK